MHVCDKSNVKSPIITSHGEHIYELLGRTTDPISEQQSVALVLLDMNKSTLLHLHPQSEESYFIIKGEAKILLGEQESVIKENQLIYIPPGIPHKLYNTGVEVLQLLVICTPAWESSNTVWLENI